MADVDINKFRASVVRDGSKPASPGFVVSEGQDPVNPPGTNNYVPYSGATANVELGEFGVEAGFITLDTTPTNTPTDQGTIFWDADDETVDIILNGYTMKIGEDLFYPVKNQTGSTIAKGVAVRFNGTLGASGRLLIAPFIADGSVPSSRFMGVTAEEILNGEDGKVLYFGRIRGINTNAFNEGDILYASTTVAGGYQTAIPVAPNNIVQVAAVVTKHVNNGTIFVRPTLGSNLNTDEAVKLTSVADKNLLQYQSGTALWENKTLAQVLGGTSSQFVKGDGSLDSTSYQPLLTNPVTGTGTTNYLPKFTGASTIGNSNLINDASGNLGLGVTPSAWASAFKTLQVGTASLSQNNTQTAYVGSNWVSESGADKYITTAPAAVYAQNSGSHIWYQAPSGTAGNAISFTQAMTLFATGNLLVGSPSPIFDNGARLQVSGTATFSGNVVLGTTALSGGGAAQWLTANGTAYGGGLISSVSGVIKAFYYYDNGANAALVQGAPGVGVQLWANNTVALSIASTGEATFSSSVTSSLGSSGANFISNAATTGSLNAFRASNSVGVGSYGIEANSGNNLMTGGLANATLLQSVSNTPLQFGTNQTARMTITSSGNVLIGTSTSGASKLRIVGLPTSAAGLSSGDVWNDSGTLKIA
jgi:hypothetical protein